MEDIDIITQVFEKLNLEELEEDNYYHDLFHKIGIHNTEAMRSNNLRSEIEAHFFKIRNKPLSNNDCKLKELIGELIAKDKELIKCDIVKLLSVTELNSIENLLSLWKNVEVPIEKSVHHAANLQNNEPDEHKFNKANDKSDIRNAESLNKIDFTANVDKQINKNNFKTSSCGSKNIKHELDKLPINQSIRDHKAIMKFNTEKRLNTNMRSILSPIQLNGGRMESNSPNLRNTKVNKMRYDHIISPLKAYVMNTTTTPLRLNMRCIPSSGHLWNVENACPDTSENLSLQNLTPAHIPKKAYYSSKIKQINDERTAVNIPGGKNMQQMTENAVLATVARHDGKISSNQNLTQSVIDQSAMNLSLVTGDISLYTLKDAQKL